MKSSDLPTKSTVNKSRSMSILIKEKISIALGKTTQNRQKSTKKTNHSSYLGKERSNSLKSLGKTRNQSSKVESRIIQKLSFSEQTPIKSKTPSINESRKSQTQRQNPNQRCELSHNFSEQERISATQKSDELLWVDSKHRKLKIINKSIKTLGQQTANQKYVDYCIDDNEKEQSLIRIEGQFISLLNKDSCIFWAKYNKDRPKIQQLATTKAQSILKLTFEGFLMVYWNKSQKGWEGMEIFSFFIEQIKKLSDDGLKQFSIITKIIKRLFQQKYPFQGQDFYLLLMKVHGNHLLRKKNILDTEKLISQKLQCLSTITGTQNSKPIAQTLFSRQKFKQ